MLNRDAAIQVSKVLTEALDACARTGPALLVPDRKLCDMRGDGTVNTSCVGMKSLGFTPRPV